MIWPASESPPGRGRDDRPVAAHVVQTYYRLSENWIRTQVDNLRTYRPLVLTWRLENIEHEAPLHHAIFERPSLEQWVDRAFRKVLRYPPSHRFLLKRLRARLVHAHFGHYAYATLPLARAARVPLISTFYGEDISSLPNRHPVWQERYRRLFEKGALFLVEGSHMRQQLLSLGCPEEKAVVHHLGINPDDFDCRPRLLSKDEPLRILVAARFVEKKGIPFAIESVARLLSRGVDAELTIIGDASAVPESQAEKREILRTVEDSGIQDRVALRGLQTAAELRQAYLDHHIFLSPSIHGQQGSNEGGAPVAIIEAAATGMPVVATHHCDIPSVVRHGETGLLASERDTEELASHLQALAVDPERLALMGERARLHVEREYNARRQGRRLEELYDRVQEHWRLENS